MSKANSSESPHVAPLTVFVVDDEAGPREALVADLKKRSCIAQVHAFSNYSEATLPLLEHQPDALFLDVEVPGRTGLEFLDSLNGNLSFAFRVVFYTGFSHYMLEAIRRSAFDYLLKPYKQRELDEVLDRLLSAKSAPGIGVNRMAARDRMPQKSVSSVPHTNVVGISQRWSLVRKSPRARCGTASPTNMIGPQ